MTSVKRVTFSFLGAVLLVGILVNAATTITDLGIQTTGAVNASILKVDIVNATIAVVVAGPIIGDGSLLTNLSQNNDTLQWDKNISDDVTFQNIGNQSVNYSVFCTTWLGYNVSQSPSSPPSQYRDTSKIEFYEDFGGDTVYTGWSTLGTQSVSSDANIMGVNNFASNTTVDGDAMFSVGRVAAATNTADYSINNSYLEVRFKPVSTAGQRGIIGSVASVVGYNLSMITAGAYFNWSNDTANYTAVCATAVGTRTIQNTGVPVVANGYSKFAVNVGPITGFGNPYVEFFINDTLRANITTNCPTTQYVGVVGVWAETKTTSAVNFRLDYLYFLRRSRL